MGPQWDLEICIFSKAPVAESQALDFELGNSALRSCQLSVLRKGECQLGRYRWYRSPRRVVFASSIWHHGKVGLKEERKRHLSVINEYSLLPAHVYLGTALCACFREIWLLTMLSLSSSYISSDPPIVLHLGHGCSHFPFMNNLGLYLGISSH